MAPHFTLCFAEASEEHAAIIAWCAATRRTSTTQLRFAGRPRYNTATHTAATLPERGDVATLQVISPELHSRLVRYYQFGRCIQASRVPHGFYVNISLSTTRRGTPLYALSYSLHGESYIAPRA